MSKKNNRVPADLPTYDEMMWPVIVSLKQMGGASSTSDLLERVAKMMGISEDAMTYRREGKNRDELVYRSDWTKWYLKKAGVVDYQNKLWILLPKGRALTEQDVKEIPALVKQSTSKKLPSSNTESTAIEESVIAEEENLVNGWRNELLGVLQNMDFTGFERLCMAVLIKSGFEQVSVTQRSNDKGIDGRGILRLNLISFRVLFQAKRWKGTIQGPEIRNFQASMSGRADKGLFVTTGRFTSGAVAEANRDGGTPVELIDGEMLCDLLKHLSIGVDTKMIESVSIDKSFFNQI